MSQVTLNSAEDSNMFGNVTLGVSDTAGLCECVFSCVWLGEVGEDLGADLLQIDSVDNRVDERRNHQKLCRQRVPQRLQRAAAAAAVPGEHDVEQQRRGEDEQRDEVRQTRLHELPAVGARPQRGAHQVRVGHQDESGLRQVREREHEAVDVVEGGVGARQLHHLPVGAEDLVHVAAAERQAGGEDHSARRLQQREAPGEQQQLRHFLRRHHRAVLQRPADRHVAVVRHDGQTGELTEHVTVDDEQLRQTAVVRDDVALRQQVVQQLRVETGRSADPVQTQVTQEDVDGLVQRLLHAHGDHERQVHQDGEQVRHEGEGEVHLPVCQRVVQTVKHKHDVRVILHLKLQVTADFTHRKNSGFTCFNKHQRY